MFFARTFTAALCVLSCATFTAQDAALQAKIDSMIHEPAVARAHWGIHVTRLDGTPIVAINEAQLFQPASNNKLFTTATVMALLPVEKSLTTTLNGKADGTTVVGDLRLVGSGDGNFSGRTVPYLSKSMRPPGPQPPPNELRYIDELADKMQARGITRVTGDIVGDDTLLPWEPYGPEWIGDDLLWYYGAPTNALMIGDNAFNIRIAPGPKPGDSAVITLNPALPFYTVDNRITTVAKGHEAHTDIQRNAHSEGGLRVLHLYGTIAIGTGPQVEDLSIDDPAGYAALALKTALIQRGIAVDGTTRTAHRVVPEFTFTHSVLEPLTTFAPQTHRSPLYSLAPAGDVLAAHTGAALYEDVVVTNKISQNQHAELLLRQLGLAYGIDGSDAQGARVIRSFLINKAGIDPDDTVLLDGSGMSFQDLATPRSLTQLLRYGATQSWGAKWKASLPVGGEDGSMIARFPKAPLKDHVYAKTGTLSEARALSGYLDCASGQTVVFSIMVNAHTPRTKEDMKTMDAIVAAIQAAE